MSSENQDRESLSENDFEISENIVEMFEDVSFSRSSLIYHYCSPETLVAMLSNKTVRFGDALAMNDGEEVIWGRNLIDNVIQKLVDRDEIPESVPPFPKRFLDELRLALEALSKTQRVFLCCFSSEGDSLSQWRAYAQDGQGFSVGFEVNRMSIPARFIRVEYDMKKQTEFIIKGLVRLLQNYPDPKKNRIAFAADVMFLSVLTVALKNPAFKDEVEVRAAHSAFMTRDEGQFPRIEVTGGHAGDRKIDPARLSYLVSRGRLYPYLDYSFDMDGSDAVKEIWMGPRCQSSVEEIEIFLGNLGYNDVIIKTAGSKYR